MARRLWLLFAQATTLALAALFVVATLRPQWLSQIGQGSDELRLIVPAQPDLAASLLQSTSPAPVSSLREAAARAMPAVVYVFTRQRVEAPPSHPFLNDPLFRRFFGDQFPAPRGNGAPQTSGLGSGVIVSPEGYILTNHHVIEGSDQIEVALADGRRATAKVVGTDPDTDLAVLKTNLGSLPVIRFGKPSEMRVGDTVLAIGNPFGVGLTVTQGIVSAVGRNQLNINTFENFIQTDAAINPGNSGGALVDANGDLIGINTAIYSRGGGSIGLGFAISADMAKQVMESLIRAGRVSRGFIGVELQDVNREIAETFKLPKTEGSIVAAVQNGGPADRAGLKAGDVVVAVNETPSRNTAELLALVAALQPGQKAALQIFRNGRPQIYEVTVTERPAPVRPAP